MYKVLVTLATLNMATLIAVSSDSSVLEDASGAVHLPSEHIEALHAKLAEETFCQCGSVRVGDHSNRECGLIIQCNNLPQQETSSLKEVTFDSCDSE